MTSRLRSRWPNTCWDSRATIIKPEFRGGAGFDDPVDVAADAGALDQLVAFTGRDPRPA